MARLKLLELPAVQQRLLITHAEYERDLAVASGYSRPVRMYNEAEAIAVFLPGRLTRISHVPYSKKPLFMA